MRIQLLPTTNNYQFIYPNFSAIAGKTLIVKKADNLGTIYANEAQLARIGAIFPQREPDKNKLWGFTETEYIVL